MKPIIFSFLLALTGCADFKEGLKAAADRFADPATEVSTVLQFVPGTEGEYGRQEALYVKSGAHYRLQKLINLEGEVRALDGTLLSGKVRFTGAQPGGIADPATIRQKEFDVIGGSFIARLVPGDYLVDLIPNRADQFPAQRVPVIIDATTRRLDLVALQGAKVRGTVRNAAGNGMGGVSVRVLSSEASAGSQSVMTSSGDGSDAGRYTVAVGPEQGKAHRIEFTAPEKFYPRVVFNVSITGTTGGLQGGSGGSIPEVALDITYEPKIDRVVTGKVIDDATGEPAADVAVVFSATAPQSVIAARRLDSNESNLVAEAVFSTQTDAGGNFSLTIPQGDWVYTLSLQAPLDRPYGGLNQSVYTFTDGTPVYRLKSKQPIVGRVRNADGKAVFAEVILSKTLALLDSQQVLRVFTDRAGDFVADLDTSTGVYDVTVLPLDGIHARCTRSVVTVTGFEESFFVHPGEKSTGFVADKDGNPLSRVAVTLVGRTASAGTPLRILAESETLTDSQGLFSLLVPTDPTLTGCRGAQIKTPDGK